MSGGGVGVLANTHGVMAVRKGGGLATFSAATNFKTSR